MAGVRQRQLEAGPGLRSRILQLYAGWTLPGVARELAKEGIEIPEQTLRKYITQWRKEDREKAAWAERGVEKKNTSAR